MNEMDELISLKKELERLKGEGTLHFEWVQYHDEGSLIIKNPKENAYQIMELLSNGKSLIFNFFRPAQFINKYLIINKQDIIYTKEYLEFKNKLNNELEGVDIDKVNKWLSQFPFFDWKIYCLKLLSKTLYFTENKMREKLKMFENFISDLQNTVISNIEGLEKSSVSLFYEFNKSSNIKLNFIFSENLQPVNKDIVFIDDFIGSGDQVTRYINRLKNEGKIGNQNLYLFAIAGLSEGIQRLEKEKLFVKVKVALSIDDKAFKDGCVFETDKVGKAKEVISDIGAQLIKDNNTMSSLGYSLGYNDSQALIFFHNNSPNNSLPIFWAEGKCKILEEVGESAEITWYPLFPRREKKTHLLLENNNEDKSYDSLKKIIKDPNVNDGMKHNIACILLKIINEGNNEDIPNEKELNKFISEKNLNSDTKINNEIYLKSIKWLEENKKDYFVKYSDGYILKLNEFQQEIKKYIFSKEKEEDADFTYVLNKID